MNRGLAGRVERSLSAPELSARSYQGMVAVAQRVQIVVGGIALTALWLLPGVSTIAHKVIVTALLLGVYLPWTLIGPKTASARGVAARVANLSMDLLAVGVFPLVIPETRIAVMSAFALMVCFHAYASGRTAGLVVSAAVLVVGAVAEWRAPPADRFPPFTVVMYATVLVALTIMLDGLAAERRRLLSRLSRLNDALEGVSPHPDLQGTLSSVSSAAQQAVGAGFVVVLLKDEHVRPASATITLHDGDDRDDGNGRGNDRGVHADEVAAAMDTIERAPETAPSGVAMLTGQPVTVPDVRTDEHFSSWAPFADRSGFRSMVSVPLGSPSAPLGTLNAYWPRPAAFDADDVVLLASYARQAGLAVARALAFDREQSAAARLAEADRIKSEFVARVSHELRTPLTAVTGFISTVLLHWEQLDDDAKRDLLGRASRNAGDLRRMVEQVLAFARSGETEVTLSLVDCALAHEINGVLEHLLPVLGEHVVDVDVHPSLAIRVDREAFQHVMVNLLSNAAKFSPAGSPIHVTARRRRAEVEVSVRDEGPGVRADEQRQIFERFYRGSSVSAKGTGIGLSIVRTFVEKLGGRVWVDSAPGAGATFTFTVPASNATVGAPDLLVG